jgi:hypothetical protein
LEPHTLLLAWFGPLEGSPPLFFEVQLLWPRLAPADHHHDQEQQQQQQAPPLAFRLLDFSADVTLDDADDSRVGATGAEAWMDTIAGHFKEVRPWRS